MLRLLHINVVEDELGVVVARLFPLNDHTVIKGLEDTDVLDRVRLVLEVSRARHLNFLLVVADFISFSLLGHLVLEGSF